jgi:large subunit ribosomal protein L9
MKIVLREDVEKLGRRGDVVKVAPGYGRNYLLPKKLAYEATTGNLKVIEHEKRGRDLRDAKVRNDFEALAQVIGALSLTVPKRVGEMDALFGSVTSQEIADLLAAKGIEVDKRRIVLDDPIKTLGTHAVAIKLHKDVTAHLNIEVVKEE